MFKIWLNMKLYIIVQTSKVYTSDLLVKINTKKFRYNKIQ